MIEVGIREAQIRWCALLDLARVEPVIITRYGNPCACIHVAHPLLAESAHYSCSATSARDHISEISRRTRPTLIGDMVILPMGGRVTLPHH